LRFCSGKDFCEYKTFKSPLHKQKLLWYNSPVVLSQRSMTSATTTTQTITETSESTTDSHPHHHHQQQQQLNELSHEDKVAAHALRLARTSVRQAILYMESHIPPMKFLIQCPKYNHPAFLSQKYN